jgi:hypothetical protein
MIENPTMRALWEQGEIMQDYWLPIRRGLSDRYLPSRQAFADLRSKQMIWYVGTLALGAQKTGRLRISVDPGFSLTVINGNSTAGDPPDHGGAAQMILYDPARRIRFSGKPIVSAIIFGNGQKPFFLTEPYTWTGTQPILIVLTNRVAAPNTVTIVLHGRRNYQ